MARTTWLWLLLTLLAGLSWTCGGGRYGLSVRLEDESLRSTARAVEVFVVDECGDLADNGATPSESVRSLAFRTEGPSPTLGSVPPGRYGLYGRVRDEGCQVIASGCVPVLLEAGGTEDLVVPVSAIAGRGCDEGLACDDGLCGPGAADGDADSDSDADGDGDGDADSDSDVDEPGPELHYGGHLHCPGVTSADLYVDAASGSDTNDGSVSAPVATVGRALELASEGAVIAVLDGTYEDINVQVDGITVSNLAGHHPVVTGTGGEWSSAIAVRADDVTVQGFEVRGATGRGVQVFGVDTVVRYVTAHDSNGSGFLSHGGLRPLFDRCVSYMNFHAGSHGAYSDGFAMDRDTVGGVIRYAVSFDNSGDGFDVWGSAATTIEHSVAFGNGVDHWDDPAFTGGGTGFRLGGGDSSADGDHAVASYCVAFDNVSFGFYTDSGDDITIEWCTAHRAVRGSWGVVIPEASVGTVVRNSIAFGFERDFSDRGSDTTAEHNSWQDLSVDGSDFLALTPPDGAAFVGDGFAAIEQSDYLHLAPGSDLAGAADDGTDLGAFQR